MCTLCLRHHHLYQLNRKASCSSRRTSGGEQVTCRISSSCLLRQHQPSPFSYCAFALFVVVVSIGAADVGVSFVVVNRGASVAVVLGISTCMVMAGQRAE
eukprot:g3964.t1 g3964   contig15:37261-37807(-)